MESEDDFVFDYESGEESEEEGAVEIRNKYFESKDMLEEDGWQALQGFEEVLELEDEPGEWGFKALKQIVKVHAKQGGYIPMLKAYRTMLKYVEKGVVTKNRSEKTLQKLLDVLSSSCSTPAGHEVLQKVFDSTLETLRSVQNERLWFHANVNLAKWHYEQKSLGSFARIVQQLQVSCLREDGSEDMSKGNQLLQVYALQILFLTITKNSSKLQKLYEKASKVKCGMADPKVTAVIKECGGKLFTAGRLWEEARRDFYEAFLCYDEIGSARRIQCLKYVVLVNLLASGDVDPLDAAEAQPYKDHPEIKPLVELVEAFRQDKIRVFEDLLKQHRHSILNDDFFADHFTDLLSTTRKTVLCNILRPYTHVHIHYLSTQLNIPKEDVEQLLVSLILDGKLSGKIDQVDGILLLNKRAPLRNYDPMENWSSQLQKLNSTQRQSFIF